MSTQETQNVAIRVDTADSSQLVQFLAADGGAYLAVKELEGTNPHIHVILHSSRKLPAIRTALKRAMPQLSGNGSYSVSQVRDLAKYQRYCMKGVSREIQAEVVAAFGLMYSDPSWQEEMHDAYWDEADQITRKRKREPVMDSVYQQCTAAAVQWHQRDSIARIYIKELISRDKPINLFALKSQINLIQCKLCPDDSALENLVSLC